MAERIPQSVAKLVVFKAYLASDHVSEATGKTIAITISKNGGAFGNPAAGATNATEISSGWYKVSLGTGDTDTVGPLAVRGAVATIDDVGILLEVTTDFATVNTKLDTIDDYVDTEIAAIKAKTDNLPSDPADASDIAASFSTVNTKLDTIDDYVDTEVAAILAAVDTEVAAIKAKTDLIPGTQDGLTFAATFLLMASVLLGKSSGVDSGSPVYRALDDSQDRVSATASDGNRSAVTLDASSP